MRRPPTAIAHHFQAPWDSASNSSEKFPFVHLDILNQHQLEATVVQYRIQSIIHFSALLSAVGEKFPELALKVNLEGFQNVLDTCKQNGCRLFVPSTIGAFGPNTPKDNTPEETVMRPNTIYGITKLHAELMGEVHDSCLRLLL
jgi:threonine 3-dehydrogenase